MAALAVEQKACMKIMKQETSNQFPLLRTTMDASFMTRNLCESCNSHGSRRT
jgi:hypothetical protein